MSTEILIVGSVAFDDIETPAGRRERSLGGSANYFAMGASFSVKCVLLQWLAKTFLHHISKNSPQEV